MQLSLSTLTQIAVYILIFIYTPIYALSRLTPQDCGLHLERCGGPNEGEMLSLILVLSMKHGRMFFVG